MELPVTASAVGTSGGAAGRASAVGWASAVGASPLTGILTPARGRTTGPPSRGFGGVTVASLKGGRTAADPFVPVKAGVVARSLVQGFLFPRVSVPSLQVGGVSVQSLRYHSVGC